MATSRTVLVVLLCAALSFAGCLGSTDPTSPTPIETPDAPPAEATDTTGSLRGEVRNAPLDPLVGASVAAILDGALASETLTDSQGRYTMNGLLPGRYIVQVNAVGFMTAAGAADIVAGAVAEKNFVLHAVPNSDPFSVPLEFAGFLSVGADVNNVVSTTWDAGDANHEVQFDFNVIPDLLETIILELYWEPSTVGLSVDLWKNPNCDDPENPVCHPDQEYAHANGFGEITVRVDRPEAGWANLTGSNDTLSIVVWAAADDAQPVVAAYQQPFTVLVEAFYRERAPEDYSLRGDV